MASESGRGSQVKSASLGRGQAGPRWLWVEREGRGEAPLLGCGIWAWETRLGGLGPGSSRLPAWVRKGALPPLGASVSSLKRAVLGGRGGAGDAL